MNVKKIKKSLRLNKRTIWDLDIKVLRKDELKDVKSGSDPIPQVGASLHPKYC